MDRVAIADLAPSLPSPDKKYIRAVVTLVWPYSSSNRQCALLLADPDYRLRRNKGQVRVRLAGPSAKAIAQAEIGIGDTVLLRLEGAQWLEDHGEVRTPGRGVDWELRFNQRMVIEAKGERRNPVKLDIDHPTPSPEPVTSPIAHVTPIIPRLSPPLTQKRVKRNSDQWSSPAFLKHTRLSDGIFFEAGYDPLAGGEVEILDMGRKRPRLSWKGVETWRYVDRTPSPEKDQQEMVTREKKGPLKAGESAVTDQGQTQQESGSIVRPSLTDQTRPESQLLFDGEPNSPTVHVPVRVREQQKSSYEARDAMPNASISLSQETVSESSRPTRTNHGQLDSGRIKPTEFIEEAISSSELEKVSSSPTQMPEVMDKNDVILVDEISSEPEEEPNDEDSEEKVANGTPILSETQYYDAVEVSGEEEEKGDEGEGSSIILAADQEIRKPPPPGRERDYVQTQPTVIVLSDSEEDEEELSSEGSEDDQDESEEYKKGVATETAAMMPPPAPLVPRIDTNISSAVSRGILQTPVGNLDKPTTPSLQPLSSPSLPLPSPFPGTGGFQDYFASGTNLPSLAGDAIAAQKHESNQGYVPLMEIDMSSKVTQNGLSMDGPAESRPALPLENRENRKNDTTTRMEISYPGSEKISLVAEFVEKVEEEEVPSQLEEEPFVNLFTKASKTISEVATSKSLIADLEQDVAAKSEQNTLTTATYPELHELDLPEHVATEIVPPPQNDVDEEMESPTRTFRDFLNSQAFSDILSEPADAPTGTASVKANNEVEYPILPRQENTPPPTMETVALISEQPIQVLGTDSHLLTPEHSQQQLGSQNSLEANGISTALPLTPWLTQLSTEVSTEPAITSDEKKPGHVQRSDYQRGRLDEEPSTEVEQVKESNTTKLEMLLSKDHVTLIATEKHSATERYTTKSFPPPPEHEPAFQTNGKPPPLTLTRQTTGLRTAHSYYTPLSHLASHLNTPAPTLDLLALITRASKPPLRAPSGPRDYHTILTLTDRSAWPDTVSAQLFRPFKAALPRANAGDVVLLRGVRVVSRGGKAGVKSDDESGWVVWRFGGVDEDEKPPWARKKGGVGMKGAVEANGPPVEFGDEEVRQAAALREWWEGWYANKVNGLGSPAKTNGAVKKGKGKA